MRYLALGARCLVQQAKILMRQKEFAEARDKIFFCLEISNLANDVSVKREAMGLYNHISTQLKKENSNQFIFAKAFPLDQIENERVFIDQI